MHPLLNTAVRAARGAGDLIARAVDRPDKLIIEEKGRNDFVTDVDRRAEEKIIDILRTAYPHHGFVGEESGTEGNQEMAWIIDPLDGTSNFIHGIPHFAVSIAFRDRGHIEHGVIYDPIRHELFTASRGRGALLNDRRIRVSQQLQLANAVLGTGFPYRKDQPLEMYLQTFSHLLPQVAAVRRCGSAALDLAYIAAGRFDGFWEMGLNIWDTAAGALLITEAGGLISDLQGGHEYFESGNLVAGNPKIFKAILQAIRPTVGTYR